jgi:hypothetical protein
MKHLLLAVAFFLAVAVAVAQANDKGSNLNQQDEGQGQDGQNHLRVPRVTGGGREGTVPGLPSISSFNIQSFAKAGTTPSKREPAQVNDMSIRFNKVGEVIGDQPSHLGPEHYPIDLGTAGWLRKSDCWSVITEKDCKECTVKPSQAVEFLGGCPLHPPKGDPTSAYWAELREVVKAQLYRHNNTDPKKMMYLPNLWNKYNLTEIAEAVHREWPGDNQHKMIYDLILHKNGKMDYDVINSKSRTEFLRKDVLLAHLNTWAIATVGPNNFGAKYFCGRARPEVSYSYDRFWPFDFQLMTATKTNNFLKLSGSCLEDS